jgi:hypothetical protein
MLEHPALAHRDKRKTDEGDRHEDPDDAREDAIGQLTSASHPIS